ncbi:HD domain-containing phosphohydrolase [Rhodocyclus tenuis]|uniref:PAS domain S-box-containing protein n=1 Tax=Rhodocyclus tenuis TaxID=1066 RepID=A0A840G407_RHOTE|nr:HD domain-containing phosphohydrolase [Rhodocyclus tenuis]MBB4245750.1 PAS domain S-box-containing protein [Rhodocyclus tenuis]
MIESQLQAALRVSESRYRRLFETAQDGILLLNAETAQIEDVNPFLIELLGYSHAEFLGKKVWEIGAFKDTALNIDAFVELRSKRYIRYDDLPLETRNGRRISVEFVSNLYDCAGVNVIQCNIRDNTKRHLAEIALRATARALQMLSESNVALLRATSEPTLFAEYCRIAVETGFYRMAWIGFAEEGGQKLVRPVAYFGEEDGYLTLAGITWDDSASGSGPVGTALRTGLVQLVEDIAVAAGMAPWRSAALAHGYHSMIALPFRFADGTMACLSLYGATRDVWSAPEKKLLQEISADLAFGINALRTAIAKTHYQEGLRVSLEQTIQVIADTVEERDAYTAGHQRRVAQLSSRIAGELGLSTERIRGLHLAATIHDLGKIGIPAEILTKPRRLSAMEFGLMKEHPQIGYEILKNVDFPWPIARIIQQHHERIDGSGYPDGLAGDALLLESQILAVADVVEAMASHRPYRAALGLDAALKEVSVHRGITFDSAVVDACLRIFREQGFTIDA